MLPKEDRELISKIGRYKYNKMKKLNLTYEQFLEYEQQIERERKLKKEIGYIDYNKMKKLGFNFEEYKEYLKERKLKKYEKKREKDKIRQKTFRYIERYCNLDMKCQICNTENDIQIHHPNYKDYLKVNLLCKKHHDKLHNFELIPPPIIDLEEIAIKKPPQKEKLEYIQSQIENIKSDILKNGFSYNELKNKYNIASTTIKAHLQIESDWMTLKNALEQAGKRNQSKNKCKYQNNPIQKYRIKHNLTTKEFSKITGIPMPTIRALESGNLKITPKIRKKLEIVKEVV